VRERLGLGRRLDQLEGAFGAELKCRCRVGAEAGPRSQTIILRDRGGDDSEPCPDCGGQRVVVVMHPSFPLDRGCGCPECVRAAEAAEEPQPARASATKRRTASPAPRSAPRTDPPSHPVAPKSEHKEEPSSKPEPPGESSGREWEGEKNRRRSSLTRGVLEQDF
jgi:hypothetical protein